MQIIQQTTRITAQENMQGVTVMYSYETENDANPIAVAFSVNREQSGGYPYIQGTVTANDFNVQNSNFQGTDIELYKHIQETCTAIINGTEKTEKSKNKQ